MSRTMNGDRCQRLVFGIIFLFSILNLGNPSVAQPKSNGVKNLGCDTEGKLRSLSSDISTSIRLINLKNIRVKAYWIDFRGKRQHYFDLEPNEIRNQQTFVTHPWLITEAGDNQPCIKIFLPNKEPIIVIIE